MRLAALESAQIGLKVMFEVGQDYKIRLSEGKDESSFNGKVLRVDLPLIVVEHDGGELIINTGSLGFISAERDDEEIRVAKATKLQTWIDDFDRRPPPRKVV
jgi:hypothetical protein